MPKPIKNVNYVKVIANKLYFNQKFDVKSIARFLDFPKWKVEKLLIHDEGKRTTFLSMDNEEEKTLFT